MINEQIGPKSPSPDPCRAKFVNRSSEKNILSITVTLKKSQFSIPISHKTSMINLKNTESILSFSPYFSLYVIFFL